jgi:hypothetical protein
MRERCKAHSAEQNVRREMLKSLLCQLAKQAIPPVKRCLSKRRVKRGQGNENDANNISRQCTAFSCRQVRIRDRCSYFGGLGDLEFVCCNLLNFLCFKGLLLYYNSML